MILSKLLGEDKAAILAENPVAFVKAFDKEPWPYQADILRDALARDEAGKFRHRVAVISLPRQNGKSQLSAWAALWRFYTQPNQEIITVANDIEQGRVILNDARRIIRNSAILYDLLDSQGVSSGLSRTEIRLKNGNRWQVKSAESVSSRGLRPSIICYDELGWAQDRDLFDTLSAGQAAQDNPLIIVTSTVGPIQAGILWELFELARAGDSTVKLIYHQDNLSPRITDEYLERERALLPPAIYAREHENRWGAGSDAFCTLADWEKAIETGSPLRTHDIGPCAAFLDLGWVHDETALAVGRKIDGKAAILALETWQGSQSRPVDFADVEARIRELAENLNIRRLTIESPQGIGMAQRLDIPRLAVEILHPTAISNRENWGALYKAMKAGDVNLPNDAKLRRQLLTLTIESKATGWRVVDEPSVHNDRAVAIAGAVNMLSKSTYQPLPSQPTRPSKWLTDDSATVRGWRKF
jgi:hypothetical protein